MANQPGRRTEKPVRGDKIWRSAALLLLCVLVYHFSYDQGRQSSAIRLEALRREAETEAQVQRREILRLRAALAECDRKKAAPAAAPETPPLDRIPLKTNQSRILFGGRLVITLLAVESADNRASVQLNFIDEERLLAAELAAGGSLKFTLDGRPWAVVVSALGLSTATLNLVELKDQQGTP